jgi:hypothetical protein
MVVGSAVTYCTPRPVPKRKAVYRKTRADAAGKMFSDQEFSEDDWPSQSDPFQGENFRTNLQ